MSRAFSINSPKTGTVRYSEIVRQSSVQVEIMNSKESESNERAEVLHHVWDLVRGLEDNYDEMVIILKKQGEPCRVVVDNLGNCEAQILISEASEQLSNNGIVKTYPCPHDICGEAENETR